MGQTLNQYNTNLRRLVQVTNDQKRPKLQYKKAFGKCNFKKADTLRHFRLQADTSKIHNYIFIIHFINVIIADNTADYTTHDQTFDFQRLVVSV